MAKGWDEHVDNSRDSLKGRNQPEKTERPNPTAVRVTVTVTVTVIVTVTVVAPVRFSTTIQVGLVRRQGCRGQRGERLKG